MIRYHVYANGGSGPIDYDIPIATVTGTSWTSNTIAAPGDWKFGVRAFDSATGLEEANLDCAVEIVLDADAKDITLRPAAPFGLRAFPLSNSSAKVEWYYPAVRVASPTQFRVYIGIGTPDYGVPVAIIPYAIGFNDGFESILSGLVSGTTYAVAVRARNESGEELNTTSVAVLVSSSGPAAIDGLNGSAI